MCMVIDNIMPRITKRLCRFPTPRYSSRNRQQSLYRSISWSIWAHQFTRSHSRWHLTLDVITRCLPMSISKGLTNIRLFMGIQDSTSWVLPSNRMWILFQGPRSDHTLMRRTSRIRHRFSGMGRHSRLINLSSIVRALRVLSSRSCLHRCRRHRHSNRSKSSSIYNSNNIMFNRKRMYRSGPILSLEWCKASNLKRFRRLVQRHASVSKPITNRRK